MFDKIISKSIPFIPKPVVRIFASKYIAGEEITDAVNVTKDFQRINGMTTIDVLGEYVSSKEQALNETAMQKMVIDAIESESLPTYLSVKPTSVGMGIDPDFGFTNILEIVSYASEKDVFVRLDMENSPYTSLTLDYYKKLREKGFENIGFVIQAYLKRSMNDLVDLKGYQPNVRLCKGIYVENPEIAYKEFTEIQENYIKLLDFMLDNGYYTAIATHDERLISYAEEALKLRETDRKDYEFQMLLGVRENRRNKLLKHHPVRIYVPFGSDWYGYSIRRFNENPEMAKTVALSFIRFWNK